jgi:paired amphipathic helix protein Sin3a
VKRDDPFYFDDLPTQRDKDDRWRYYVATYSNIEDTEGIDRNELPPVVLARNMNALGIDPKSDTLPPFNFNADPESFEAHFTAGESQAAFGNRLFKRFTHARNDEKLVIRIAVSDFHPVYEPYTAEGFWLEDAERSGGEEGVRYAEAAMIEREERMKDHYIENNPAVVEAGKEAAQKADQEFVDFVDGKEKVVEEGEKMEVDG